MVKFDFRAIGVIRVMDLAMVDRHSGNPDEQDLWEHSRNVMRGNHDALAELAIAATTRLTPDLLVYGMGFGLRGLLCPYHHAMDARPPSCSSRWMRHSARVKENRSDPAGAAVS